MSKLRVTGELRLGVWLWMLSWWFEDRSLGSTVFVLSYLLMIYGMWRGVQ